MDCLSMLHLEPPPDVPQWAHPQGERLPGCRHSCLLEQTAVLLSYQDSARPAMQEHCHHGSCLTIAFSGRPRLRSVLGTTLRKAVVQDCVWSCTCCTHNRTSWTHRGRVMEISSGASPSSQLGQQLPNLYKKEICTSLRASNKSGVYTPHTSSEFFSQQLAVLGGFSPCSCFKRGQQREPVMAAWAVGWPLGPA